MVKSKANNDISLRPSITDEAREMRIAGLAFAEAERRLLDGTASSQLITTCIKLASTRERLEKEILARQGELLQAKTKAVEADRHTEEIFQEAMDALKDYRSSDEH